MASSAVTPPSETAIADTYGLVQPEPLPFRGGGHLTIATDEHSSSMKHRDTRRLETTHNRLAMTPVAVAVFPQGCVLRVCGTQVSGAEAGEDLVVCELSQEQNKRACCDIYRRHCVDTIVT